MLSNLQPDNLICIDIETVPAVETFNELNKDVQEMFKAKTQRLRSENQTDDEHYFNSAGIYAEFGKVICICVGMFIKPKIKTGEWKLRIKSFSGDEKEVLKNFSSMLNKLNKKTAYSFAGHNIREFDIPYLCRRMMVHQMELPGLMNISGKKPYEVNWFDTMQL